MATVSSKSVVDQIIAQEGHYYGDPQVIKIVQYNNTFDGKLAWGLIYKGEDPERYHNAPACHNPQTIWEYGKA
jgi:hypothetical protein